MEFFKSILTDDSVDKRSITRVLAFFTFITATIMMIAFAITDHKSSLTAGKALMDTVLVLVGIGASKSAVVRGASAVGVGLSKRPPKPVNPKEKPKEAEGKQ